MAHFPVLINCNCLRADTGASFVLKRLRKSALKTLYSTLVLWTLRVYSNAESVKQSNNLHVFVSPVHPLRPAVRSNWYMNASKVGFPEPLSSGILGGCGPLLLARVLAYSDQREYSWSKDSSSDESMFFLRSLSLFLPRDCPLTFCPPLSAMICGASRPSGALADCRPVATVVGGVLVVTIFAPIRGGKGKKTVEKT